MRVRELIFHVLTSAATSILVASLEEGSLRTSVTVVVGREIAVPVGAAPGLDSDCACAPPATGWLSETPLASRLLNPPVERALLGERVDAEAEEEEASMALSRFIWSSMDVGGDTWKKRKT